MARLYHVDIARHAASADHKWVDNLLSHFTIPGVDGGRQGAARRISAEGIEFIALVRLLNRALGLSVASAVKLADRLVNAKSASLSIGAGVSLHLDVNDFRGDVHRAIADAVESVTPVRRGRPRKSTTALP